MDYSLLIGVQPKHHDRQGQQNLAELVSSIKRWFIDQECHLKSALNDIQYCRSSQGFKEDARPLANWGTETFTEELDDEVGVSSN